MIDLNTLNSDDDLSKLNNLLAKSLTEEERRAKYAAKEKAKQKHLLQLNKDKARQQAILNSNLHDLEVLEKKIIVWEYLFSLSHHVMQICSNCGNSTTHHSAYYNLERNTKNQLKRLVYTKNKPIVYRIHYTQSKVDNCIECENFELMLLPQETAEHKNVLKVLEYDYLHGENLESI